MDLSKVATNLVENIWHILFVGGFFDVAQLWNIFCGDKAVITYKGHALVRHLVAFKMDLVVVVA
jgi:hypothetical protein